MPVWRISIFPSSVMEMWRAAEVPWYRFSISWSRRGRRSFRSRMYGWPVSGSVWRRVLSLLLRLWRRLPAERLLSAGYLPLRSRIWRRRCCRDAVSGRPASVRERSCMRSWSPRRIPLRLTSMTGISSSIRRWPGITGSSRIWAAGKWRKGSLTVPVRIRSGCRWRISENCSKG